MRVTEARLLVKAARKAQFPRAGVPEFAFVGRSNVGKSRLLNALVGYGTLARISSKPGCTRGVHFFELNRRVLFVDLPGYGYTKVSASLQASWKPLVQSYLVGREPLHLVWHLVDSRHAPMPQDIQLHDWLRAEGVPVRVALTKADKLSQSERARCVKRCREVMGLSEDDPQPLLTSARKKTGIPMIWKEIQTRLESGPTSVPEPEAPVVSTS